MMGWSIINDLTDSDIEVSAYWTSTYPTFGIEPPPCYQGWRVLFPRFYIPHEIKPAAVYKPAFKSRNHVRIRSANWTGRNFRKGVKR